MADVSIELLPETTRAKIRSTQILTSLPQIVSELLQNSLDAGARQVDIGIDCEDWSCWVKDDGHGISKEDLSVLGSEKGRYGSSKAYTPDSLGVLSTFGFRGEALASAADLCCLEICSRTRSSRSTWSIILKGGKSLYSGKAVRWQRETPGTTVCIRDAFYNVPVRRRSHPSSARTIELIKQEVEAYALVFSHVSFSIQNTRNVGTSTSSRESILRIPKTPSTVETFGHLFGRALIKHIDEIDFTSGDLRLSGFISLNGAPSKAYQYFYVNRHPMSPGDLHRLIDSRFDSSSFVKHAYEEIGETQLPRATTRRSPRKAVKKVVYVLNLTVPPREVDNCLEPAKALIHFQNKNVVEKFISSAIDSFLARHAFTVQSCSLSSSNQLLADSLCPSPSKRRKVDFADDSGYAEVVSDNFECTEEEEQIDNRPFVTQSLDVDGFGSENLLWKDPSTGESFLVESRTGHSRPFVVYEQDAGMNDRSVPLRRTLSHSSKPTADAPKWIQKALEANNTYRPSESKISTVPPPITKPVEEDPRHGCHVGDHHQQQQLERQFFSKYNHLDPSGLRFEKSDLRGARIIGQVDKKFVACVLESRCQPTLVLIDQHAADERIRVERFLKDLCLGFLDKLNDPEHQKETLETRKLAPPIPILLTTHEVSRLANSRDLQLAFSNWGICFSDLKPAETDDNSRNNGSGYSQVFVQKIPEVVSDKLLHGDELRHLVKGFLAKLETDVTPDPTDARTLAEEDENALFWLKALRWCPRELLDLVNSKACRGAIMFNDTLNREQCERLVLQLSQTAFPFQCAHGRPSLAPLANLGRFSSSAVAPETSWSRLEDGYTH